MSACPMSEEHDPHFLALGALKNMLCTRKYLILALLAKLQIIISKNQFESRNMRQNEQLWNSIVKL